MRSEKIWGEGRLVPNGWPDSILGVVLFWGLVIFSVFLCGQMFLYLAPGLWIFVPLFWLTCGYWVKAYWRWRLDHKKVKELRQEMATFLKSLTPDPEEEK